MTSLPIPTIHDVVTLLQALIRIPSVNPENAPGTERTGEEALANFLAEWLEASGARVELEEVRPGRPNLIARFAPMDCRPRILLGPHLDTVGIGGMTIDPFAAEIRDGRVWGRGASDTKGPMAAMLWGWLSHRQRLAEMPVAVDFVAFMGEESSQWGSKEFAAKHAQDYRFALVGEPTSLQVVHVTKGSLWTTLRTTGKAAHSSQPHLGENAALKLARALDALDVDLTPRLAGFEHAVLGGSTWNLGVIRGGSRPNIVPDLAEAEIDLRITPSLAAAGGGLWILEEAIARLDLPVTLHRSHENPPMETAADHPAIRALLATDDATGLAGAPWFSDAAHLSQAGIPSICIGPGSIHQAHTADEFLSIAELEKGARFFADFISTLEKPQFSGALAAFPGR